MRHLLSLTLLLGTPAVAATLILDGSRLPDALKSTAALKGEAAQLTAALKRAHIRTCGTVTVLHRAQGSFVTRADERLYLVQNCGVKEAAIVPHRKLSGDLMLTRSGQVVAYTTGFADALAVLPDLNGDGRREFASIVYFGPHMGSFTGFGALHTFKGTAIQRLMGLGDLYTETDVPSADGSHVESTLIRVRTLWFDPARLNRLAVVDYESPGCACRTPEAPYDPARARRVLSLSVDLRFAPEALP